MGNAVGPTTGLSRYARALHQALAQEDVETTLVGLRRPPIPRPLVGLARRAGLDVDAFFQTYPLGIERGGAADLTHLTSQNQGTALAWRSPGRVVVTVHDLITLGQRAHPEITGYMTWYDRVFDDIAARGLARADAFIADSAHSRADIHRLLGISPDRTHVVYLGIDHDAFRPGAVPADFLARHGLRPDVPYILYVGSEDPRKNLQALLAAVKELAAELPEVMLLKVGGARFGSQRHRLVEQVESLGLQRHVRFFDQVSQADLVSFYRLARVFVLPSLYEGFGFPLLEAMACGTPVVSSDATSLPELASDAALLVGPRDIGAMATAIRRILTDATCARELRERGLRQAQRFTWQRAARETADVYRATLARSPTPGRC